MHNSDMDMAKGTPLNMTWDRTAYFHGAPGAPAELALFGPAPRGLFAPDRFVERPELSFGRYLDLLASELDQRFPVGKIRLIGFSAGARVALEVAHRLGARIDRIDLIAPAAPLQSGDFMAKMQGRAVFRLARHAPGLFPAVTWLQGRLGAVAPDRLYRMVFANAAGEDALLAADPAFRSAITDVMRRCLGPAARGYAREIIDFVRPWDAILDRVSAPVRLWQGDQDNWTPPDMAEALRAALSGAEPVRLHGGLSHYSTLRWALRELASEASQSSAEARTRTGEFAFT
jgi:pimeloyl-ACP methyl ester carboxylesterase